MSAKFIDIDFGPDDAKEDVGLIGYFYQLPGYKDLVSGKKRYIIGAKGCGKTATREYLRFSKEEDSHFFQQSISLRDFPLGYIRELRDKKLRDKSQYVSVWMHLILVELCKMVIKDHGAEDNDSYKLISDYIKLNGGIDYGVSQQITLLKENSSKVKIGPKWLSGEDNTKNSSSEVIEVNFRKINDVLISALKRVCSESDYFIFIDELDEGYSAGDKNLNLILLALLRAIEDLALILRYTNCNYKPILVLRSDIFDRLEDNDLNKLDDYVLRLRWSTSEKSPYSLKKLINKRITSSLPDIDGVDWNSVSAEEDQEIPFRNKSLFNYVVTYTRQRPRDIIKLLKVAQDFCEKDFLDYDCIRRCESDYSDWFYREIRDEVHSHLPI
tara:strand:- start:347 stop:1498 length:1152 start_codon:yes stop_codon:yes gene_type:complete